MSSSGTFIPFVVVGAVALCFGLATCAANCGEPSADLYRALEGQGLTNAKVGDWAPLSCSEGDSVKREFTATNPNGKRVSGVICCGLVLKSCTVRW